MTVEAIDADLVRVLLGVEVNKGKEANDMVCTTGSTTSAAKVAAASGSPLYPPGGVAGAWDNLGAGLVARFKDGTATAALRGKEYPIKTVSWSADVLTLEPDGNFAAAPASGDEFELWGYLKAEVTAQNQTRKPLQRDTVNRDIREPLPSRKGLKVANGGFGFEMAGLENPITASDYTPDRLSALLRTMFSLRQIAGTTIASGGTLSNVMLPLTSVTGYEAGDVLFVSGQFVEIQSVTPGSPNQVEISPPLKNVPSVGDAVNGTEVWTPYDNGHGTMTVAFLVGHQLRKWLGCVASLSISAEWNDIAKGSIEFDAEDWSRVDSQENQHTLSKNLLPAAFVNGGLWFGTTRLPVKSFQFNDNQERQIRMSSGRDNGQEVYGGPRVSTIGINWINESSTRKNTDETLETPTRMVMQVGGEAGDVFGIVGMVQSQEGANDGNTDGDAVYEDTFRFTMDTTNGVTGHKRKLVRA